MADRESSISSSLSNVQSGLQQLSQRLSGYLGNIAADIEEYKFDVQNIQNGIKIDIAVKLTLNRSNEKPRAE
jgi:DNA anti-recombination protein RmuC